MKPMPLDRCAEILATTDWSSEDRFSPDEKAAITSVMTHYMMGDIDRARAGALLHQDPDKLPPPWKKS